jgi:hypothetical protein
VRDLLPTLLMIALVLACCAVWTLVLAMLIDLAGRALFGPTLY